MAYNYEYPYTDSNRYNDDWLIGKVKEVSEAQEALEERQDTLENFVETQEETLEARLEPIAEDYIDSMIASGAFYNKGAGAHNGIYRGKNLGTSVTAEQWTAIQSGDFDDLFIGDYWIINNVTWRIAGFDYYLHTGDTECNTHHVVMVPDGVLYDNTTMGSIAEGYAGAKNSGILTNAESAIEAAFGNSHILTHRVHLSTATSGGKVTNSAWFDSKCDLMTLAMVYGSDMYSPVSSGTAVSDWGQIECSQLPLFTLDYSKLVLKRESYWLRDPITSYYFANVYRYGIPIGTGYDGNSGIRPVFCIK